MTVVHLCS